MGCTGCERSTRRAVAQVRAAYRFGRVRVRVQRVVQKGWSLDSRRAHPKNRPSAGANWALKLVTERLDESASRIRWILCGSEERMAGSEANRSATAGRRERETRPRPLAAEPRRR